MRVPSKGSSKGVLFNNYRMPSFKGIFSIYDGSSQGFLKYQDSVKGF